MIFQGSFDLTWVEYEFPLFPDRRVFRKQRELRFNLAGLKNFNLASNLICDIYP